MSRPDIGINENSPNTKNGDTSTEQSKNLSNGEADEVVNALPNAKCTEQSPLLNGALPNGPGMPKNVFFVDTPVKDPDEEESLKDLYQELDLKRLELIYVDNRAPDSKSRSPLVRPYGGKEKTLDNLTKEITFLELKALVAGVLRWPIEELRIWDQTQYEEYLAGEYDLYERDMYRDTYPCFASFHHNEVVYPFFLTDQYIVAERFTPGYGYGDFPASPNGEEMDEEGFMGLLAIDWRGVAPDLNKVAYSEVEVIRMDRAPPNNTLFNSLGYLLQVMAKMKGEKEIDDMQQGITQPSRYRAARFRKELAQFVMDHSEELERSTMIASPAAYVKKLLSPDYKGGELELTLSAVMRGVLVQVFDVAKQRLVQYGRGYVERHGNPERLTAHYAVKLVRWGNGVYDPMTMSMGPGMEPDRSEQPFCFTYTKMAFDWLKKQSPSQTDCVRRCSFCNRLETVGRRHRTCAGCRSVFYCSGICQCRHWSKGHRGVCQTRDFKAEASACAAEEKRAYAELAEEVSLRMRGAIGIKMLRRRVFKPTQEEGESDEAEAKSLGPKREDVVEGL